jgi:hypothetical protein
MDADLVRVEKGIGGQLQGGRENGKRLPTHECASAKLMPPKR